MASNRSCSDKPLVALEADKLLGVRQVAKASKADVDRGSREPGGTPDSRAEMSRLLSKIIVEN